MNVISSESASSREIGNIRRREMDTQRVGERERERGERVCARVILFGKKYRGSLDGWTFRAGNVVSSRPTFGRIAAVRRAGFGPTFTLQRRYRISCRRCNRRCNLCLVLRASAYGLKIRMYTRERMCLHLRIHVCVCECTSECESPSITDILRHYAR